MLEVMLAGIGVDVLLRYGGVVADGMSRPLRGLSVMLNG